MSIQTIFKAGNSQVVAIPQELIKDMKLKTGQKVEVLKASEHEITIRKSPMSTSKTTKLNSEFRKWLNNVLEEDAEILDELAVR